MLQQFMGEPDVMGVYWTLQIELIFYFICGSLFVLRRLDDVKTVAGMAMFFLMCAFGLSVARFIVDGKFPVALPLALSVMFWGLCIRYFSAEQRGEWKRALAVVTVAILVMVPIISLLAYNKDMGFHETWYKYTTSYYLALGLFYPFYRHIRLTGPTFVWLGTISYSLYLFGPVAQEAVFFVLGAHAVDVPTHFVIAVTMALTVAIAAFVYRFVEAPAVALGRPLRSIA
jgi:peptidoglycan/LPS O-acetylase OafA/YrhL